MLMPELPLGWGKLCIASSFEAIVLFLHLMQTALQIQNRRQVILKSQAGMILCIRRPIRICQQERNSQCNSMQRQDFEAERV